MTERAKRLADYLENELDWIVYDRRMGCGECGETTLGMNAKFCSSCGNPLEHREDVKERALEELEGALKYTLEE